MRQPPTIDTGNTRCANAWHVNELQHFVCSINSCNCHNCNYIMWLQTTAKGKKKAKGGATAKQRLPFVLTAEQQQNVERTLGCLREEGHIPRGWSTLNLQHCFSHPSYLKAHDWLLLTGPIGKFVLQVSEIPNYANPFLHHVSFACNLLPTTAKIQFSRGACQHFFIVSLLGVDRGTCQRPWKLCSSSTLTCWQNWAQRK